MGMRAEDGATGRVAMKAEASASGLVIVGGSGGRHRFRTFADELKLAGGRGRWGLLSAS